MSHITDVRLRITNLEHLETAWKNLGGTRMARDQKSYRWYGRFMNDSSQYGNRDPKTFGQCEHALVADAGGYEIGVVKAPEGQEGFDLLYDSWGPGARLEAVAGRGLAKLRQEYAAVTAMAAAQKKLAPKGFRLQRELLASGVARIRAVKL